MSGAAVVDDGGATYMASHLRFEGAGLAAVGQVRNRIGLAMFFVVIVYSIIAVRLVYFGALEPGATASQMKVDATIAARRPDLVDRNGVTLATDINTASLFAEPRRIVTALVRHIRRVRPDVVVTFGPDGAYGHPDHIAVSQFTSAAIVAAADASFVTDGDARSEAHRASKLYYLAWPSATWDAYQQAFKTLVSCVDGIERHAVPWPDWAITTSIDTSSVADAVWNAVQCHTSQISVFDRLRSLSDAERSVLWGPQHFYRAWGTVNGGRTRETDLFEGIH